MNYEYMSGLGAETETAAPEWAVRLGRQIVESIRRTLPTEPAPEPVVTPPMPVDPATPVVTNGNGVPVIPSSGNGLPPANGNGIPVVNGNGTLVTNGAVMTNGAAVTNGNGAVVEETRYFGFTAMQLAIGAAGAAALYVLLKR